MRMFAAGFSCSTFCTAFRNSLATKKRLRSDTSVPALREGKCTTTRFRISPFVVFLLRGGYRVCGPQYRVAVQESGSTPGW